MVLPTEWPDRKETIVVPYSEQSRVCGSRLMVTGG